MSTSLQLSKLPNILSVLQQNGLKFFTRPYELNLVGVRTSSKVSDKFDDWLYACFKTNTDAWMQYRFKCTTDPGLHFINKPMNSAGTAVLKAGQYINAYQLGIHRGKYRALVQRKPITVYRQSIGNSSVNNNGKTQTGYFGINIHHASGNGTSADVNRWSAGCQVIANINDFKQLMGLAEQHAKLHGNNFTYTLIDFRAKGYVPEQQEPESNTTPAVKTNFTQQENEPEEDNPKKKAALILASVLGLLGLGTSIYLYTNKPQNKNDKKKTTHS